MGSSEQKKLMLYEQGIIRNFHLIFQHFFKENFEIQGCNSGRFYC